MLRLVARELKSGPEEVTWAALFKSMLLRRVTDLSIKVVASAGWGLEVMPTLAPPVAAAKSVPTPPEGGLAIETWLGSLVEPANRGLYEL